MTEPADHDLLATYARTGDETAFAALVARHLNLVHSAARRYAGNEASAAEITQAVFLILARKAGGLRRGIPLAGWLYQTARLTAANLAKADFRRQQREQEAYMQSQMNEADAAVWRQIAPLLDHAMGKLGAADRAVLVLRFFENQTNAEAAAALGLAEGAVQKRAHRALEKLRKIFAQKGVTHTAEAIAGTVAANAIVAAPAGLALKIAALAAQGAVVSTSLAALVKGTLKTITWVKYKFAVVNVGLAGVMTLVVVTLANADKTAELQPAPPVGGHAGVTFFSMLEKTLIVSNAVFEKELFMSGIPQRAQKQTFSFLSDGDNYQLNTDGISAGSFDEISWHEQNGYRTFFDPKINKPGGYSGGTVELESNTKMTVDLFLSLGISTMIPGSAVWTQDRQRFTAKTRDGKDLTVETTVENGVPSAAYIIAAGGQRSEQIEFKYSPGFYGGQVPVEFTAYWIKPDNKNDHSEDQKIFDIRVRALEISDDHLDKTLLDPNQIAGRHETLFFSNNIVYWVGKNGNVSRVLTSEENKKEIERIRASKQK